MLLLGKHMKSVKIKKNDPRVSWLVKLCYPSYNGRRPVIVEEKISYYLSDYWDGGSRNHACFVDLNDRRILTEEEAKVERQETGNWFNLAIGTARIMPSFVVVENCIFCGKDMGIRIYVHPESFNRIAG